MPWILLIATIGFLLSLYAYYVERRIKKEKNYVPFCDFKKNVSCSKAFTSRYGHLAVLPNSLYGIIFYVLVMVLTVLDFSTPVFFLSLIASLGSIALAYLSYVKQHNFCVICTAVYAINVLLFFLSSGIL